MTDEGWLDEVDESVMFVPRLDAERWTRLCALYLRQAALRAKVDDEQIRVEMLRFLEGVAVAMAVALGLPSDDDSLVDAVNTIDTEILASLLRGDDFGMTDEKATLYSMANSLGRLNVGNVE